MSQPQWTPRPVTGTTLLFAFRGQKWKSDPSVDQPVPSEQYSRMGSVRLEAVTDGLSNAAIVNVTTTTNRTFKCAENHFSSRVMTTSAFGITSSRSYGALQQHSCHLLGECLKFLRGSHNAYEPDVANHFSWTLIADHVLPAYWTGPLSLSRRHASPSKVSETFAITPVLSSERVPHR
jgi:hypothetical protein